jgi:hypothetical protein
MAHKTFYTERDLEDLARRGVQSLTLDDSVVLTDLAFEKAQSLGIRLVQGQAKPPSAPQRPYIAGESQPKAAPATSSPAGKEDLHQRVREAVVKRLGDELDANLLDSIIRRVLENVGAK